MCKHIILSFKGFGLYGCGLELYGVVLVIWVRFWLYGCGFGYMGVVLRWNVVLRRWEHSLWLCGCGLGLGLNRSCACTS